MKHLFILNPHAGRGLKFAAAKEAIAAACKKQSLDAAVEITERPRHAAELVARYAGSGGPVRAYACGGDGTLGEVVCGASGFDNVQVTHFPCGTGNDFIRMFGDAAPRFSVLEELITGDATPVDVIDAGGRCAINVFSVGFDAQVARQTHKLKWASRFGSQAPYNLGVVSALLHGLSDDYEIEIDGRDYSGCYTLIAAMNGQHYGGGFHPAPRALPHDGLLEFLLVKKVGLLGIAGMIGAYADGKAETLPICRYIRGYELRFRAKRAQAVNFDGESHVQTEGHIRLRPGALPFVLPKGLSFDMLGKQAP